jgi:hypothetical protein
MKAYPRLDEDAEDWALGQAHDFYVRDELTVGELETAIERILQGVRQWWEGIGPWRIA